MSGDKEELLNNLQLLKNVLISRATGRYDGTGEEFVILRKELLSTSSIKAKLPKFLNHCRTLDDFWSFIQPKFESYRERRAYLNEEFEPLLQMLEITSRNPSDQILSEVLERSDLEHVQEAWQKSLERRTEDPDGAITAARTLLETVCKNILDEENIKYKPDADLPALYKQVSSHLNLAPSQHTEEIFKRILGSCASVVEGLGTLRNRQGDAHGKGKGGVRAAPRHAQLAVNLAGTMATFLVETWETTKKNNA